MDDIYEQALARFKENKIRAALPLFEKVIDKQPDNIDAKYKFGICLYRLKEFSNAEQIFRDVIAFDHAHHKAWYYLGLALEGQKKLDEAKITFEICLVVKPDFTEAKKKLSIPDEPVDKQNISELEPSLSEESNEGPGKIIYSTNHRRFSSFSFHCILIVLCTFPFFYPDFYGRDLTILALSGLALLILILFLVLRSYTTRYTLYEKRIDFKRGIFFKRHKSVWLFEIKDLDFYRNPWFLITRNAAINIVSESGNFKLVGLPPPKHDDSKGAVDFTQKLFDSLRVIVRSQRGEIKKVWI